MLELGFSALTAGASGGGLSLLCLGAHSDDIEIGCAGTISTLLERYAVEQVTWVVFAAVGKRAEEARASAAELLAGVPHEIVVHAFRDGFFPYQPEIKEAFEQLKHEVTPSVVFTHYRADRHQDHRVISDLTWNSFRDHLVLEYEIPKYDGDLGVPNLFVPLAPAVLERKVDHLERHFASQRGKHWYDAQTFRGLARLRGLEVNAPSGYAEAYYGRKVRLG